MILDRQSRINTNDLRTRLKVLLAPFSPDSQPGHLSDMETMTEFINQMQVYEGAMYEISTKLEILDSKCAFRTTRSITWSAASSPWIRFWANWNARTCR